MTRVVNFCNGVVDFLAFGAEEHDRLNRVLGASDTSLSPRYTDSVVIERSVPMSYMSTYHIQHLGPLRVSPALLRLDGLACYHRPWRILKSRHNTGCQ